MAEQAGSGSALKGPAWCGGGGSSCVGGREGHQGLGGVQQSRVAAGSASKGDCRGPEGLGLGWWGVGRGHAFQRPLWTRARGRETRRDVRWRERDRGHRGPSFFRDVAAPARTTLVRQGYSWIAPHAPGASWRTVACFHGVNAALLGVGGSRTHLSCDARRRPAATPSRHAARSQLPLRRLSRVRSIHCEFLIVQMLQALPDDLANR